MYNTSLSPALLALALCFASLAGCDVSPDILPQDFNEDGENAIIHGKIVIPSTQYERTCPASANLAPDTTCYYVYDERTRVDDEEIFAHTVGNRCAHDPDGYLEFIRPNPENDDDTGCHIEIRDVGFIESLAEEAEWKVNVVFIPFLELTPDITQYLAWIRDDRFGLMGRADDDDPNTAVISGVVLHGNPNSRNGHARVDTRPYGSDWVVGTPTSARLFRRIYQDGEARLGLQTSGRSDQNFPEARVDCPERATPNLDNPTFKIGCDNNNARCFEGVVRWVNYNSGSPF